MAQFIVSASQLEQKRSELIALKNKLDTLIAKLETESKNLDSMWEGDAKNKFKTAMIADLNKIRTFITIVIEFISILKTIIDLYNQVEQKNAALAGS